MGIRLTTKADKISMKKYYLNIIKDKDQRIAELEQELAELKSKYEDCENERLQNRMDYLTMKNKWLNSEKKLAELKEKAIVPKFKVGQEVYYYHIARNKIYLGLVEDIQYFATRSGIFYRIPNLQRDYFWIREDELFATEQEAQEKLKEMKGNE